MSNSHSNNSRRLVQLPLRIP